MVTTRRIACLAAAAFAFAAVGAGAQQNANNGRWACQVDGVDIDIVLASNVANVTLGNGERFTLRQDPDRRVPFYTDGSVALTLNGGDPMSTRSGQWVRHGNQATITRCRPVAFG